MKHANPFFPVFIGMTIAALTAVVGFADRSTEAQAATVEPTKAAVIPYTVEPDEPHTDTVFVKTDAEYEVDEHDLYCMAHLLAGECQTGSREMQEAVGSVVLNRKASKYYPDTIEGVIFDMKYGLQYACTKDGNYYRQPTALNWEVAEDLLRTGSKLPANVVFQSQRSQGDGIYTIIGNEYFCILK